MTHANQSVHQPPPASRAKSRDRRRFLQSIAAGAAAAGTVSHLSPTSYAKVVGANERMRVGVMGIRGMGYGHVRGYSGLKDVEVAAVCDVDQSVIAARTSDMQKRGLPAPQVYTDIREMLDDPSIDAISVATPNHWHALAAYWAVQAGKHAAVEKPGTHN